ncbi:sugar kinase [Microbacterium horticulturae]|uniref:Sugar kinase n=1 Tax=Microbacterium horticulturae TaxID=3028316 RepID=A0ABY8BXD2_9MICO|nr:sugar kinase [Microbacterium sp. KACC 23027]WEG08841.1 sugar kinase [Microbacterium sp. KACC 23027]
MTRAVTHSAASTPRLITLGESMVMLTPAHAEHLATADSLRLHVGGAESNVAIHATALGVDSAWVSAVGADVLGDRVRDAVARHGVDVRWVRTVPDAPTGVYFKDPGRGVLYYRRGSAASQMGAEALAGVPLEQAVVVHVSGITPALSPTCAVLVDTVIDRVAASPALLSFDVNHRAALWASGRAAPALQALARRADLVFVGLDEAHAVWGCETPDDVRRLLPEPARLVVKDGDVGATEYARAAAAPTTDREAAAPGEPVDVVTFVPATTTEVVEPVGAGDAFAAGYLAALIADADATGRLAAGHARACLVLRSSSDLVDEPLS